MPTPIPAGYHSVTPYLVIDGAAQAIAWYQDVFGGREVMQLDAPDGRIGHAEVEIGDNRIMLADQHPEMEAYAPGHYGGSPITLVLYLPDVDAVVAKAVGAGATLTRPVEDKFYGDRMGSITDPFGHVWHIATHVEDVAPAEIARRMREMSGNG